MHHDVVRVRICLGMGPFTAPLVNAYLARCGESWIVIDAGPPGSSGAILAAMERHEVAAEDVGLILITHGHFDHFGGAMELRRRLGPHARIAMHPADRPFVSGRLPSNLRATCAAGVAPLVLGTSHMGLLYALRQLRFWTAAELAEVIWLDEVTTGRPVDLSPRLGLEIEAELTPGHTAGSMTLRLPRGDTFTGDIISSGFDKRPAWPLLVDDPPRILPSLQRIAAMKPTTVYPGHGRPFEGTSVIEFVEALPAGRK